MFALHYERLLLIANQKGGGLSPPPKSYLISFYLSKVTIN
jgi:hypothetical protein